MSQAERESLIPLARKVRGGARREALQVVVEAALAYHTELERDDQAHGGRLRMREEELCAAIEQAVEVIKTGPVTDDDLLVAMAMRDAQGE